MKLLVTMKDPDTLSDALTEAENDLIVELMADMNLTKEEATAVAEKRIGKMREFATEWFKWGEYITVELNDKEKTAKVVKPKD